MPTICPLELVLTCMTEMIRLREYEFKSKACAIFRERLVTEMNKNMVVRYDVSCFRFATCALRLFNRSECTMVPRNSASSCRILSASHILVGRFSSAT